jgi:hypothetical protein
VLVTDTHADPKDHEVLHAVSRRCRGTVRDYERLPARHETIVYWAMTITMSRRLARQRQNPGSAPELWLRCPWSCSPTRLAACGRLAVAVCGCR